MDRTNTKVNVINDRFSSQQDKIIEHLQSFGSISPKEALKYYGSMRLSAHIFNLKQNGWNIVTTMKQSGNMTWAEYWLEERFRREHKQATDFNLANSGADLPLPKAFFKQEREHYENISNGRVARLEDVLRKDYERYRDMAKDEVRFPVFMNRQKFQNVADAIERIVDCFDFVDDVRNEENQPDVNVSKLTGRHYSAEEDAINLQHNKHYGEK